eukprot:5803257-Pleurochrysis_carterae.AAC.1
MPRCRRYGVTVPRKGGARAEIGSHAGSREKGAQFLIHYDRRRVRVDSRQVAQGAETRLHRRLERETRAAWHQVAKGSMIHRSKRPTL